MRRLFASLLKLFFFAALLATANCSDRGEDTVATAVPPTPTSAALPTQSAQPENGMRDFVVIATDAPNPNFTDFDRFGNVIGFNNDLMARLAAIGDFEFEFVVTPHEGLLESISSRTNSDFDAVMSALVIPEIPSEGLVYTVPYLEIGQVLMVLADERVIVDYQTIQPGMAIGVERNSSGQHAALEVLALAESDVFPYDSTGQLMQALADGLVDAVIVESYAAEHFATAFPEQLKIAGGVGREAWITSKGYGIAVSSDNEDLLNRLNQAIIQAADELTIERLTVAWLIPQETINAGESRVPTPASEFIIGVVGQPPSMDPASGPDLIGWELKTNTMSGLFSVDNGNNLVPVLAADFPVISEDKLEYTFNLRRGLRFPDGSELTADDVKWAINRAASMGNFLVNSYLKDSDEDNFADEDSVQVIDQYTVKMILAEPTSFFLSLLATPPYFPISDACYQETLDPTSVCGGIGPFRIVSWEADRIRLKANPDWPGKPAPAFENINVRFYDEAADMVRSMVDFQSVDLAWTGLPFADQFQLRNTDLDGDGTADFSSWEGPGTFKSYLIFEQDTPPWDKKNIRQAAALAIDRDALASEVFSGSRKPLFSPLPDAVPGHLPVLPQRNLAQARALLLQEGYDESRPLAITIWFSNDGHYTPLEEAYANGIKNQLEETNVFQVSLEGAPWDIYRQQLGQCAYGAYLLGWPTPGQPPSYLDMTSWTDFFITNTSSGFCSNYDAEAMLKIVESAREELDPAARLALYGEIQQLWAEDLPTLDLTQETRQAVSLPKVDNVVIDAMGLLHYEVLTKGGG